MKKLGALSLVLLIVASALPADDGLALSGELNSGLVFEKVDGADLLVHLEREGTPGRAALNFQYTKDTLVFKWRFVTNAQSNRTLVATSFTDLIPYAFGTFGLLDDQISVSIGRIDGALWGSGGPADKSSDAVSGIRFEFKPGILPGLSAGFSLPAVITRTLDTTVTPNIYKSVVPVEPADYFSELIFGVKYALADILDVRLGLQLDGDNDAKWDDGNVVLEEDGTKFHWGLSPTILGTFVPGLSVWVDMGIAGLGITDGTNTVTGFKVGYAQGNLDASLPLKFETHAKSNADTKTKFIITPAISYKVTPWFKPGIEVNVEFLGYEDNPTYTWLPAGDDPKPFDKLELKPYLEFDLGGGFKIVPAYTMTLKGASAPSAASTDSKIDNKFEIRFDYSF
jgi:hypothetical protein